MLVTSAFPDPEFEDALRTAFADGQRRWSNVALGEEPFRSLVKDRSIPAGRLRQNASDIYLAAACRAGLPSAIEAFQRVLLPQIDGHIRRLGLPPHLNDELKQRLQVWMLTGPNARIDTYNGTIPLASWLRVCAFRMGLDLIASERRAPRVADDVELIHRLFQSSSVEAELQRAQLAPLFRQVLEESLASLSQRDKTLLRLQIMEGLSIDAIAPIYRVHRATVARWLVDIRRRVVNVVRQHLRSELRTNSSELTSMIELLRGDIQLSLSRILRS